jgi:hypothetical protein
VGNRGLPRLGAAILARERAIWAGPCALPSCTSGAPVAGVIEGALVSKGFCAACCDRAEGLFGHVVRREPFEGVTARQSTTEEPTANG